jgi:lysyl-tRNA synthetase class 2
MALTDLKEKAGLSGKKWDKSMKALSKHDLLKVVVEGDLKSVHLTS